jgi:hypothetical protein
MLERWTGTCLYRDTELVRDDLGKCRFAEAWRAVKQHMVQRFITIASRLDGNLNIFLNP